MKVKNNNETKKINIDCVCLYNRIAWLKKKERERANEFVWLVNSLWFLFVCFFYFPLVFDIKLNVKKKNCF